MGPREYRSTCRMPLRQTLILAYHQDLKYREIAEILKIPVGTVKSRLHAAASRNSSRSRGRRSDSGKSNAMKADEMIDFVLGQVDGADRNRYEQSLRGGGEPSGPGQKHSGRQSTGCSMNGTPFEHPPDLAQRTVTFIARNRRRTFSVLDYAPVLGPVPMG